MCAARMRAVNNANEVDESSMSRCVINARIRAVNNANDSIITTNDQQDAKDARGWAEGCTWVGRRMHVGVPIKQNAF